MKKFKKALTLILAFAMSLSISVPIFADIPDPSKEFSIDNYIQHTISFNEVSNNLRSNCINTIDEAISYVKSLNLSSIGYSYIEEACLLELENYKESDIELESYTVLIPKSRAKKYFGTYLNSDFYYEYTSAASMRRETEGSKLNSTNKEDWTNWILGVANLAMCFVSAKIVTIPYTLISNATGIFGTSPVKYGSYNQYVEQFSNVITRTVYKEKVNGNLTACYQDQESTYRVKLYFCPVGTDFSSDYIEIGQVFYGDEVRSCNLTDEEVLQSANAYANRGAQLIFLMTSARLTEEWEY